MQGWAAQGKAWAAQRRARRARQGRHLVDKIVCLLTQSVSESFESETVNEVFFYIQVSKISVCRCV